MEEIPGEKAQETIVHDYLCAFMDGDVNRMLCNVHPAIHYERYIAGEAETVDNGSDKFRTFLEQSAIGMDQQSLQVVHMKTENDRVDISFRIVTAEPYPSTEQPITGWAMFWFMDQLILQIVVQLNPKSN